MKYNLKKKNQIALRRFYSTSTPSKSISGLLGIDKQGFIDHVNKYCLIGMTEENFGKVWGLDHIVPVELFDLENEDDLKLCYNYINIMPMFINDNRLKGASVHFSVEKLNSLPYTNVYIQELLIRCNYEIERTYKKYLL